MKHSMEEFRKRGGIVVGQRDAWRWHEVGATARVAKEFLAALAEATDEAPVAATGGEAKMHMMAFTGRGRMTVALVNDFSWVQTGRAAKKETKGTAAKKGARKSAEGENEPAIGDNATGPPNACRGVIVTLRMTEKPAGITESVTGKLLSVSGKPDDWRVAVPDFDCMAVLTVESGPRP